MMSSVNITQTRKLNFEQQMFLEQVLGMGNGFVLNFYNWTFARFFEDYSIDIYSDKYKCNGDSKARRMRAFWKLEQPALVAKVLKGLWDYGVKTKSISCALETKAEYFEIIASLEEQDSISTHGLVLFQKSATVAQLIQEIKEHLAAGRYNATTDRLHTYCVARVADLLTQKGVAFDQKKPPLHSLMGMYIKKVENEISDRIKEWLRFSRSVFEALNKVRNDGSLAHSNELIDNQEAKHLINHVMGALLMIKDIEEGKLACSAEPKAATLLEQTNIDA